MAFCWKLDGNMKVLFGLLLFLFVLTEAQDNCNYKQSLEPGKKYYVYNSKFPNNNEGPLDCKWQVTNPEPINVKVDCNISIPTNTNCEQGSLSVQFLEKEAELYCGVGTITIEGKNPTIIFKLSSSSQKAHFICTLQQKFDENNCRCGYTKTTKIVGGKETGVNEFPMLCGIVDLRNHIIFCGCTIVSQRFVITAAHCLVDRNIKEIAVVVGEHDVTTGKETNATKLYPIIKIYTNDDLALCKIKGVIIFSPEVGPVCLPFQHSCDSFGGAIVTVLGWGLEEFGGTKSDVLQKVDLNVINPNECKRYYNNINNTDICTYTPEKDSCQMDSGGPVLWMNPTTHRFVLIGTISGGVGCASDDPAINTRVGAYLPWIIKILSETPGEYLCKME